MRMMGGRVVPPYDPEITVCGYCGERLVWSTRHEGGTAESWAREQAYYARRNEPGWRLPMLAWGPPVEQSTYGCPRYGQPGTSTDVRRQARERAMATGEPWTFGGPDLGWHYFWWDEGAAYDIIKASLGAVS